MHTHHVVIILVLLITGMSEVIAQDKGKVVTPNGEMPNVPGLEEKIERLQRLLENPDFLKLKVSHVKSKPIKDEENLIRDYKTGSEIGFELVVTNTSTEPFNIAFSDFLKQTRPHLAKDGRVIHYHKKAAEAVRLNDVLMDRIYGLTVWLYPDKPQSIGVLKLSNWYEPLEPGTYELTIKNRLTRRGKWIEAPTMTFKVIPE